ncbi:MAG: urea transporter [Bacteroidia bacterium]
MSSKKENFFYQAFINSYSQLFFSDNKTFAVLIFLSTFFDPLTGLSGIISITTSVLFSYWIGLDRNNIRYGVYSFNALMIGLAFGLFYQYNLQFFILLVFASLLSVLFYVILQNISYKYKVPVMSLPFLISLWIMMLGMRVFNHIELKPETFSSIHASWFGLHIDWLTALADQLSDTLPAFFIVYFKSISAIFFQYNIIAGLLAAAGLLIYSRIAFSLSFIGFSIGYLFYYFMVGTFTPLLYSYIGFNFILTAIALGGYFVIPSVRSYVLVIIAMPIIAILISACSVLLLPFQLPLFSLPFNIALILFMMLLNVRVKFNGLSLVMHQLYSPEKNLYYIHNQVERFKNETYFHIHLPFFGEWNISQGYDGKITHKEDWRYAWDFTVVNEMKQSFKLPGTEVTDYFCYNLPVLAPDAGTVWNIIDGLNDNEVGDVDIKNNWGNTIIIRHGDFLYSKLCHLKKGSMKVKIGDYVQRGEMLATCGSSGRSPEPHIHFQLQSTPYVGSKTMMYPLSYYLTRQKGTLQFHSFDYPTEGQLISRVAITPLLADSFNFIPGVTLKFEVEKPGGEKELVSWEVFTDAYNQSYLYCPQTKSFAYFVNNGTLHYFTDFTGDKNSMLYHFYLAAHKILLGYYPGMEIKDRLPISLFYSGISRLVQDFTAPFLIYLKAEYSSKFISADDSVSPKEIRIGSIAQFRNGRKIFKENPYELVIRKNKIAEFIIQTKQGETRARCIA